MKRIIASFMVICMMLGLLGNTALASEPKVTIVQESAEESSTDTVSDGSAGESDDTVSLGDIVPNKSPTDGLILQSEAETIMLVGATDDTTEVTRVQWLHELTTLFEMSVAEDNYPDNYYSDIDSSSVYYYDVMLATEFGLIDTLAGEAFEPDAPTTREFAAHTLNICLGYTLEETAYTFSDVDAVTYLSDVQVAVNRGWIELMDGKFLPNQAITSIEKDVMLADAMEVLASAVVESDYNSSYELKEGILVLPKETIALLTNENELTIYDCSILLQEGALFAVVADDFPVVYRAISVTESGNTTVVQTERLETQDAFESIDVQGIIGANLADIQAYNDNVQLNYIVGGTAENEWEDGVEYSSLEELGEQEISAVRTIENYDIPEQVRKAHDIADGVKAEIVCTISDVKLEHKNEGDEILVKVDAKVTFSCNISADIIDKIVESPSYDLAYIPIGHIGYFKLSLDLKAGGNLTINFVNNVTVGLQYIYGDGFRTIAEFKKEAFSIQAKAQIVAGVKFTLGVNCGFLEGSVYGRIGAEVSVESASYADGKTPVNCLHIGEWLYASIGYKVEVDLFFVSLQWTDSKSIFNRNNSPVRLGFHYEDGVPVNICTRDVEDSSGEGGTSEKKYKYYTPADSKYGYNGASGGVDSAGNEYKIFEYKVDNKGNAIITSYNGNVSALSIPSELDGYTVTGIDVGAFRNNARLCTVVIPDSVTSIGSYAFEDCSNLSMVVLSKNLTSIYDGAFKNCVSISTIVIPEGITSIYADTFWGCTSLAEIVIPDSVVTIGRSAFENCSSLSNVVLSKNVSSIGYGAFKNCDEITKIEIPKSLETTTKNGYPRDYGVFNDCDNLKEVTFEEGTIEVIERLFANCGGIESIVLPDTIVKIREYAFSGCNNLVEIDMPDSITEIEEYAFGNTNVKNIVLPKSLKTLEGHAFFRCENLESVEIPKSLQTTTQIVFFSNSGPFYGCGNLNKITFEEGITEIPSLLFANCSGIESVDIPDSVTRVGSGSFLNCVNLSTVELSDATILIRNNAFKDCVALKKILIPSSVKEIEDSAFAGCSAMTELVLTVGLQKIGNSAFSKCSMLQSVEVPNSVTEIGSYAFEECKKLYTVTLSKGLQMLGTGAFINCDNITSIQIPQSLQNANTPFEECNGLKDVSFEEGTTIVVDSLLSKCPSIEEIVLPDTVSTIGENAFSNCISLSKVYIPDSVEIIEESAFAECSKLTQIELANNLKRIGNGAFQKSGLINVSIPNSVEYIGRLAFRECQQLEKVTIGMGVKEIPYEAFDFCSLLKNVHLVNGVTTINDYAFRNCPQLTEISIPRSVTSIGEEVFTYPTQLVIYGIGDTSAEQYAAEIGATFIEKEIHATDVTLNYSEITMSPGATINLVLQVTPEDFTDTVEWKCANTNIATVNEQGMVSAIRVGATNIKVTVGDQSTLCKVTVRQPVTCISLSENTLSLSASEKHQLVASIYPADASNKEIIWRTSNSKVATVNSAGIVTGISKGKTVITATSGDGSGISAECTVTVNNSVVICQNVSELESTHNYTNKCSDMWIYQIPDSDSIVVTFDEQTCFEDGYDFLYLYDGNGVEIGKYTGTELAGKEVVVSGDAIKIQLVSDSSSSEWGFKVTSVEARQKPTATKVVLSDTSILLKKGETKSLTISVTPIDYTDEVIWTSSDTSVITVSDTGEITARAVGIADITVTVGDLSATCTVTVTQPVSNIKLSASTLDMKVGDSQSLTATITPNNASDKSIQWRSSDIGVATVNQSGKVTALKKGTVTITATAQDGSGKTASCKVTVRETKVEYTEDTGNNGTTDDTPTDGWYEVNGSKYWYENGVKQGTEGRGKEIYDSSTDAWYWLDSELNGAVAKSKDVYQESLAGTWGDVVGEDGLNYGKWVRYDESGHMVKGWQETAAGTYYFDETFGTMAKGFATIDKNEYYFDEGTGILQYEVGEIPEFGWNTIDGKDYWYENYVRQGFKVDDSYRGKEIYDQASDAWYWLDNVQGGAKAVSKDVYQESYSAYPDREDGTGKWVRYDENGRMVKGWQTTEAGTYYFEEVTGSMAKGTVTIDGEEYHFNEATGILQ